MKITKFLSILLVVTMLIFSCKNTDDETSSNNSGNTDVSLGSLKVGSTVTYKGEKYLVTKNTLKSSNVNTNLISRNVLRNVASDSDLTVDIESENEISKDTEYVKKYLDKEFRANILKQETGITEYIELLPKIVKKETSHSGYASLEDDYTILNEKGKRIAIIRQRWLSIDFIPEYFGISGTDATTAKFNTLTEDELREYDPSYITLYKFSENNKKNWMLEIRYDYYPDSADTESPNYKKINFSSENLRTEYYDLMTTAYGKENFAWRIETRPNKKIYKLSDPKSASSFSDLSIYEDSISLRTRGDGIVGGSTNSSDYETHIRIDYSKEQCFYVDSYLGEITSQRTSLYSNKKNGIFTYSDSDFVHLRERISDDGTNFTITNGNGQGEDIQFSEIAEKCDFVSFANEKISIEANGTNIEVPASMTIHAHYAKNTDGSYPVLDKYGAVTCYPAYDSTKERIIYKLTDKSIEDFINVYKNDFSTLKEEE